MRLEIHSAANFLVHLLRLHHNGLTDSQLEMFKSSLTDVLRRRYQEHWFPEKPTRGSGYRCLRINGKMDPVIAQAGTAVGLPASYLHSLFPSELTMWIDPSEVSYRIGENGSICVLYEESSPEQDAEDLNMERVIKADNCGSNSSNNNTTTTITTTTNNNNNNITTNPTSSNNSNSGGNSSSSSGCKESMRTMEFFLDPRGVQPFEQLAAFVSS